MIRLFINLSFTLATGLTAFWLFDLGSRLSDLQLFITMLALGEALRNRRRLGRRYHYSGANPE